MLNLTTNTITLQRKDGTRVTIEPSEKPARVKIVEEVIGEIDGIPVVSVTFGEPEGLPEEGTPCIVRGSVFEACRGRKGMYREDRGFSAIRDGDVLVAVTRLVAA